MTQRVRKLALSVGEGSELGRNLQALGMDEKQRGFRPQCSVAILLMKRHRSENFHESLP